MKRQKKKTTKVKYKIGETVNHPSHYNQGKIEVIDFVADQKLNFDLGNAVKYICRSNHKGKKVEDLRKAIFYLKHELEQEQANPRTANEMAADSPT